MKKEVAKLFISKFVKVERQRPGDERPFYLFGLLEDVDDENLILRTKTGLGTVRLVDTVSMNETQERGIDVKD